MCWFVSGCSVCINVLLTTAATVIEITICEPNQSISVIIIIIIMYRICLFLQSATIRIVLRSLIEAVPSPPLLLFYVI